MDLPGGCQITRCGQLHFGSSQGDTVDARNPAPLYVMGVLSSHSPTVYEKFEVLNGFHVRPRLKLRYRWNGRSSILNIAGIAGFQSSTVCQQVDEKGNSHMQHRNNKKLNSLS